MKSLTRQVWGADGIPLPNPRPRPPPGTPLPPLEAGNRRTIKCIYSYKSHVTSPFQADVRGHAVRSRGQVRQFRGGLVFKARRLVVWLKSRPRVIKKKKKKVRSAVTGSNSTFRIRTFLLSRGLLPFDPPECIHQLVLESQLPHEIVNLLFTIPNHNIKLTVLWGSWFSTTDW